jgi:glutamate synthase (NADPH/NADH) small chain
MAPSSAPDIRPGRLRPEDYRRNFEQDLDPPLDSTSAVVEASRCLFCWDAPCIEACPTGIDIPRFIRGILTGNLKGAATTILDANILGGTCARVCPTDVLCEGACVRMHQDQKPVEIGALQRYATDWLMERGIQPYDRAPATGKRIAVVGAGPAGLACAHGLARRGHDVVIFERREKPGGLNEYGIAAYKMVDDFAQREVAFVTAIGGIEIRHGQSLGPDLKLAELVREFDAVFLGIGLSGVNALQVPGEELEGVIDAVDFIEELRRAEDKATIPIGRNVVVIGGGNTAIDAGVQSRRLGAENVTIVYRRGRAQMSATPHEQEVAQLNGVRIRHWARPVRLFGEDGHVRGVEFERTQLDAEGRLVGTGERYTLAAEMVLKAVGQVLVPDDLDGSAGLVALERGKIAVDAERRTAHPKIWAGGDCAATGEDLTVQAVEDGKRAAASIHQTLLG